MALLRLVKLKTCSKDCPYFQGEPDHIHFPTWVRVDEPAPGVVAVKVPAEYVRDDGSWNVERLALDHPWFGPGRERGDLAEIVP